MDDLIDIKIKKSKKPVSSVSTFDQEKAAVTQSQIISKTAPRMKKSRLEVLAIKYGVSETIRLNTLEKSKLDWNKFVEEEGIKDELKRKNRDGYMERQAFLQRVENRKEEMIRDMKRKV